MFTSQKASTEFTVCNVNWQQGTERLKGKSDKQMDSF